MRKTETVEVEHVFCDACGDGPMVQYITDTFPATGTQIELCLDCYLLRHPPEPRKRRGRPKKETT